MIRTVLYLSLALMLCVAATVHAADTTYTFIGQNELRDRLQAKDAVILVDICVLEQFQRGHIAGSLGTQAYPVETDEERARLAELLPQIQASTADVIIICPRGGGGAKRTVDFYLAQGVDANRLLILERGMDGWPFETEGP